MTPQGAQPSTGRGGGPSGLLTRCLGGSPGGEAGPWPRGRAGGGKPLGTEPPGGSAPAVSGSHRARAAGPEAGASLPECPLLAGPRGSSSYLPRRGVLERKRSQGLRPARSDSGHTSPISPAHGGLGARGWLCPPLPAALAGPEQRPLLVASAPSPALAEVPGPAASPQPRTPRAAFPGFLTRIPPPPTTPRPSLCAQWLGRHMWAPAPTHAGKETPLSPLGISSCSLCRAP